MSIFFIIGTLQKSSLKSNWAKNWFLFFFSWIDWPSPRNSIRFRAECSWIFRRPKRRSNLKRTIRSKNLQRISLNLKTKYDQGNFSNILEANEKNALLKSFWKLTSIGKWLQAFKNPNKVLISSYSHGKYAHCNNVIQQDFRYIACWPEYLVQSVYEMVCFKGQWFIGMDFSTLRRSSMRRYKVHV